MPDAYLIQHRISSPTHRTMYLWVADDGALCWTFEREKAKPFETAAAANKFASNRIAGDVFVGKLH